jgi:hypothetical protein
MNSSRPRPPSFSTVALVLAAVAAVVLGLVTPAAAATSNCGTTWGSQPKVAGGLSDPGVALTGVHVGRYACYDRLVLDLSRYGGAGGYDVDYAPVVGADGVPIPLRGAADLRVNLHAPAYDLEGHPTYVVGNPRELVSVGGYRTFRQVAWAGSFEGYTLLGLGTRARLPFRVFLLSGAPGNPSGGQLVIDVAHRW